MHTFPANQTTNRSWTYFVCIHRLDFRPCKKSLCSEHFEISCFVGREGDFSRQLHRGSVSTLFTRLSCLEGDNTNPLSGREKRLVSTLYFTSTGVVHTINDLGLFSVKPS